MENFRALVTRNLLVGMYGTCGCEDKKVSRVTMDFSC